MKHLFSRHVRSRIAHTARQLGVPGMILVRLGMLAIFIAFIFGLNIASAPFVSPEMRFTDASAQHLSIVPASGESPPPVPSGCGPGTLNDMCPVHGCGPGTLNDTCTCAQLGNCPIYVTPHGCGPGTLNDTCTCEQLGNCPVTPHGCGPGTLNDTCTCAQLGTCPLPPGCTQAPTTATACGQTSTYDICTGTFNTVGTFNPSLPGCGTAHSDCAATAGSQCYASGACGSTEGVIQCSGLCNASPPACPGSGTGTAGPSAPAPEPPPPPPTSCQPGYHVSGSSCVFYACPVGFKRTGQSTCVFTSCPSGYTQHGQSCTPNSCPATLYYCGLEGGIGDLYKETYSGGSCTPYDTLSQHCDYGCDAAHSVCNANPGINASISARPQIIRSGDTTVISWQAFQVSSCTVTANNGDSWSCTARQCENGSHISSALTAQTTYMLSCAVPAQANVIKNVIVNIIPVFNEQ